MSDPTHITESDARTFKADDSLPRLYIPSIQCGHCFSDVQIEDGYAYCSTCLIQWDEISEDADAMPDENEEGADVPCAITSDKIREPYDHSGRHWVIGPYEPCILPSGHEGDHLHPHEITVTPLAGVTPPGTTDA